MVKNLPAIAGDLGSIPGLGRCPGEGHGNPFQYSCLENSMDRGSWWATVPEVAELDKITINTYTRQRGGGEELLGFLESNGPSKIRKKFNSIPYEKFKSDISMLVFI